METEFVNVLKYDFYADKLPAYHDIACRTINIIIQMRSYDMLEQDEFEGYMGFFVHFYPSFMQTFNKITYRYQNMMDQIFDIYSEDESNRSILDTYISEQKIEKFNEEMSDFEENYFLTVDTILNILDEVSLQKMFITDIALLKVIEMEFNDMYERIELIEKSFGDFGDIIE